MRLSLSIIPLMIFNKCIPLVKSSFILPRQLTTHAIPFSCRYGKSSNNCQTSRFSTLQSKETETTEVLHEVEGVQCREVHINLQKVGHVTILEATADAQNTLVDMALATEEEMKLDDENHLKSGDPYGAVLWPAASAVADHLLAQESYMNEKGIEELTILELGAGTGLVSIAAAVAGVPNIKATDYEKIPLKLLEFAAKNLNNIPDSSSSEERLSSKIETFLFDICDENTPLPSADIVVAADIMYEPKTGIAMAHRVIEALRNGSRVIVGCSPGR